MDAPHIIIEGDVGVAAPWIIWGRKRYYSLSATFPNDNFTDSSEPTPGVTVQIFSTGRGGEIRIIVASSRGWVWETRTEDYDPYEYVNRLGSLGVGSGVIFKSDGALISGVTTANAFPYLSTDAGDGYRYWFTGFSFTESDWIKFTWNWNLLNDAEPFTDATNSQKLLDSYYVPAILSFIKLKESEIANGLLNGTSWQKYKSYKLAIASVKDSYFFKQFAPPTESDPNYKDYQSIISALRESGYVEVPGDKFLLEGQETLFNTIDLFIHDGHSPVGIELSETNGSLFRGTAIVGNFESGVYCIDYENFFPNGVGNLYSRILANYKIHYDVELMELVKTNIGVNIIADTGFPAATGWFYDVPTYYADYDGINFLQTRGYSVTDLLGVGDLLAGTGSQSAIPTNVFSGSMSLRGKWNIGRKVLDIYADNTVRDSGESLFSLPNTALTPMSVTLSSSTSFIYPWQGWVGFSPFSVTPYIRVAGQIESEYVIYSNIIIPSAGLLNPNILARNVGSSGLVERLLKDITQMILIRWPNMTKDKDGLFVANLPTAAFQTNAKAYRTGKRTGLVDAETMAGYLATMKQNINILYNNFMTDEAIAAFGTRVSRELIVA